MTKTCSACRESLGVERFSKNKAASDGLQYRCKGCSDTATEVCRQKRIAIDPDYNKARKRVWYVANRDISIMRAKGRRVQSEQWRQENKPRTNARMTRWRRDTVAGVNRVEHESLMRRFREHGLTLDQYHAIVEKQDFCCAICGEVPTDNCGGSHDGFHIDHHHVTGKVRGLLCGTCNVGIGMLKDSSEVIIKAAEYLERFSA